MTSIIETNYCVPFLKGTQMEPYLANPTFEALGRSCDFPIETAGGEPRGASEKSNQATCNWFVENMLGEMNYIYIFFLFDIMHTLIWFVWYHAYYMIEVDQLKSTVNQYNHNVIIQSCECVIPLWTHSERSGQEHGCGCDLTCVLFMSMQRRPFVRLMVLQTKTNYSPETYTRRRKNGWMSSIRPHNIRDTACESPFLKFFEGRDRLEGHKGLQTTRLIWFPSLPLFTFLFEDLQYALFGCCCSEMPSFRWRSKILGREHVGSSPTSLSPDSMVIIKLSCYVFKVVKQYNLLFGLFFGYFGTLDFLFVHVMSRIIATRKRIRSPMRDEVYTDGHWNAPQHLN